MRSETDPPDYAVFWDDDDYFVRTALQTIAANLKAANYPALPALSKPLPEQGHSAARDRDRRTCCTGR